MKILANIAISVAALLAVAFVCYEGLLLTIFSATHEFWYAAQATAASIVMLTLGILFRRRVGRWFTIGTSLFFSVSAAVVLLTHFGMREDEGYIARMEISLPSWHYQAFFYGAMAFSSIPAFMLIKKWPNKRPESSAGAAAVSTSTAPSGVAHL